MCSVLIALSQVLLLAIAGAQDVPNIEEGGLFEGDIILRPEEELPAVSLHAQKVFEDHKGLYQLWPGKTLPYEFSSEFSPQYQAIIERALADLQRHTCVRFVHRTTERTYIRLRNTNRGCASQVGYHPLAHGMDLYLSAPGCMRTGTIQHEFLHALGFWHEHTRPDRDRYIKVQWQNILSGRELNFLARSLFEPHERLPYDYSSVMHYRAVAFSKDRLSATIIPRDHRAFFAIGQRRRFSWLDIAKLNILYNCGSGYYSADEEEVDIDDLKLEEEFLSSFHSE